MKENATKGKEYLEKWIALYEKLIVIAVTVFFALAGFWGTRYLNNDGLSSSEWLIALGSVLAILWFTACMIYAFRMLVIMLNRVTKG